MSHCFGTLHTITKSRTEHLEAINIIFDYSSSTIYLTTLALAGISSLQARHLDLSKHFSETFIDPKVVYMIFSYPLVT